MLPCSFYFVRHGETDWNARGVTQGHTDIPLNDNGRRRAEAAVPALMRHQVDRIVCSTLSRARETAVIINKALNKPLHEHDGLRERSYGDFEGCGSADFDALRTRMRKEGLIAEETGYPCPPNAEPYETFKARIVAAMAEVCTAWPGENILFVAHGGVYRVLRRGLFSEVDQSPNVAPFHFEKGPTGWRLSLLAAG